ncbi:MAG: dehydrogenase E1 component subunit alpha/beta [Chlorobi bacterium]|nr:MAG: 2-oxoisovalerate dehydrogenase E1 component [Chlorobi bacterium OLB7]MBK8910411.1 dehydrogenase E1 component subunit alpha/beta [Chlorobiota bacterium]MBX7217016.1 dehydrogenase E1 component subunit alpha/beta [Candidatus Kapabacteria bacterium]
MKFDRTNHSDESLLHLYEAILLPRMIEEKMLILLRQGRISKWFSGIGQEAISVGMTQAIRHGDYILPLHRNLGVFTGRQMPLDRLFRQWQGKADGYTKGRDRSFHFGTPDHRVIGMISHLGAMLGVADGIALASNLDREETIAVVFSGDGGASEGDFHEAINVAAVWELPVIFLVENNGYGLSTPSRNQFRFKQFIDKAIGYGIEGVQVDGNNVLEVYDAVAAIAAKMRTDRKPVILEGLTFRMRGHEEASGTAYVPKELFEEWELKDPVKNYEAFLLSSGLLTEERIREIRKRLKDQIEAGVDAMLDAPDPVPNPSTELADVYAPGSPAPVDPERKVFSEKRLVDAVSDALRQGMERDPKLVIMGQDIAEYGGVFKVTEGFVEKFGAERVRNTPLCESAIVGAGLGLSIGGRASVVEMQFSDFVTCGFNQIVNNLAKTHYRWGQPVNVTVRMPTGAGVGAGPFHSQSTEAWFTHVPGLKVAYPATPFDAKGLLTAALAEPNPVMFFEHKLLYRSIKGMVPDDYYTLPFGQARVARVGARLTLVTYGLGVHWATALADELPDADIEVIDLRTLIPWDQDAVFQSVQKTGRCLVLHEDTLTGGFGGEIAATISEKMFHWLDAPVVRVGSMDTPVPFNRGLEEQFFAKHQLRNKVMEVLAY